MPTALSNVFSRALGRHLPKVSTSQFGPKAAVRAKQSPSALPPKSDVDLFRYREGVIDLDAEIPDGTLKFGMAQRS
jgi:hypothetical protein